MPRNFPLNDKVLRQLIRQIDESESIEEVKDLAKALLERESKQREMIRVLNAVLKDIISFDEV